MSLEPSLSAGKEVVCYCTKCKIDLSHTIVAMQGDRILRVHCKTCKSEHNYKAKKGVTEKAQSKKKASTGKTPRTILTIHAEWESRLQSLPNKQAHTYSPKSTFKLNDIIDHPQFGQGIVDKLIHPNKVEILFAHEFRVLIHSPASSISFG